MNDPESISILRNTLNYSKDSINKLIVYKNELILYNRRYNLISRSTEDKIWFRHFLDSAQIAKYIDYEDNNSLSDLGTGAGFPGLVLAINNKNRLFHVKLYEKSKVKCNFINSIIKKLEIKNVKVHHGDLTNLKITSKYIVIRAFKKLQEIINISREKIAKPHKIIILKGKSAQEEINKALKFQIFEYKLENSITDKESKIVTMEIK